MLTLQGTALSEADASATLDTLEVVISAGQSRQRLLFRDRVLTLPAEVPLPAVPAGATLYLRATSDGGAGQVPLPRQLAAIVPVTSATARVTAALAVTCDARSCVAPPPRQDGGVAFDPLRRTVVLFGGVGSAGQPLGDTWEWDGAAWTAQTAGPAPAARFGHAMAFDARLGHVVLFGGDTGPLVPPDAAQGSTLQGDTWEYLGTGQGWQALTLATAQHPSARRLAALSAGPLAAPAAGAAPGLVLFGGEAGDGVLLGDTWTFDGAQGAWQQRVAATCGTATPGQSPLCRSGAALAYIPSGGALLLGGRGGPGGSTPGAPQSVLFDDTLWSWDGAGWQGVSLPAGAGPSPMARVAARWQHQMISLAAADGGAAGLVLISGGQTEAGLVADSFVLDLGSGGFAPVQGLVPAARAGAALVFDGERDEGVLVGGGGAQGALRDTWSFVRADAQAPWPTPWPTPWIERR